MEKIKIFATPEAYEFLTDVNSGENAKYTIQDLFDQIKKEKSRHRDSYSSITLLGISAIWANESSETSIALIYRSEKILGLKHILEPDTFWADISTATPIDFI